MPIAAFDAPGPRVTNAMPGPAGELAVRFGHVGDAAFLAANDEPQPVADVVERVQHGEIALAGDAECEVRALRDQVVDQNRTAGSFQGQGLLLRVGPVHTMPLQRGFGRATCVV